MPATDEDLLRDLMHRATGDLHARPEVSAGVISLDRRRQRRARALGLTVTGAAAVTAIGVAAAGPGSAGLVHSARGRSTAPVIRLTAAERTLNRLSAAAAAAPAPAGRWVKMTELAGSVHKTTIVDTRNGNTWTYQSGDGAPPELVSPHGLPTAAQLAAYPTTVPALRAFLLQQASQQQAAAERAMRAALKEKNKGQVRAFAAPMPHQTASDLVFGQAAYVLWNPVISPALRAALLKVIAATPGVVVSSHARDSLGRAAVEISRYDRADNYTMAVFEAPDGTGVLETSSLHPATSAQAAYQLSDTYLSITWSAGRPAA
jgi:hypothetical protein